MPADSSVSFVHRRSGDRDFYFVCNILDSQPKTFKASFRAGHQQPQIWDPMTGETRESVEYEWTPDETTLPLK